MARRLGSPPRSHNSPREAFLSALSKLVTGMLSNMLKSLPCRAGRAALVMSAILSPAMPAAAQYGTLQPYVESPQDALSRNVRLLAQNPRNFPALVAAGRAALATGDAQAAVGFFGRAEEIGPRSWQPQAGMGAAMVAMADPQAALTYFGRAQAFGATQMQIAVDRGMAFDLMGDQAKAQSDYRVALLGAEADEARRRLALSLAISRDNKGAAATIAPLLLRRGDQQAVRVNAFVLALAGDVQGARRAIDAAMPGAGMRFEPFFRILPTLAPAEKAAAVHLGIFPKDAAARSAYTQAAPMSPVMTIAGPRQTDAAGARPAQRPITLTQKTSPPAPAPTAKAPPTMAEKPREPLFASIDPAPAVPKAGEAATSRPADPEPDPEPRPGGRLDGIAELLSKPDAEEPSAEPLVRVAEAQPAEPQSATASPRASKPKVDPKAAKAIAEQKKKADRIAAEKKAKLEAEKKAKAEAAKLGVSGTNWVQLAGGANKANMAAEYKRLRAKAGSVLKARAGYVTEGKDYFRLLVGPFPSTGEAQEFVTKLDKAGVDSFRWTRTPPQIKIEKLKT